MKDWKDWVIATIVSLAVVAIMSLIGQALHVDIAFLEGWFGASGYFITLSILEERYKK
jgi:exosortase/archaeosortase